MMRTLEGGLEDLSISRSTIDWGIPLPGGGVLYVWFDALINYISALGYPDESGLMARYWPGTHLIGKEIARFHTMIWPAMLWSAGLAEPERIFAHGWITVDGEKMSKSVGNVIDPFALVDEFGADAVRYFLFREAPFGSDFSISIEKLRSRYNSDLGNDLGNLLRRSLAMLSKYRNGLVPAAVESDLGERFAEIGAQVHEHVHGVAFSRSARYDLGIDHRAQSRDRRPQAVGTAQGRARRRTRRDALRFVRRLALHGDPARSRSCPRKRRDMWRQLGLAGTPAVPWQDRIALGGARRQHANVPGRGPVSAHRSGRRDLVRGRRAAVALFGIDDRLALVAIIQTQRTRELKRMR